MPHRLGCPVQRSQQLLRPNSLSDVYDATHDSRLASKRDLPGKDLAEDGTSVLSQASYKRALRLKVLGDWLAHHLRHDGTVVGMDQVRKCHLADDLLRRATKKPRHRPVHVGQMLVGAGVHAEQRLRRQGAEALLAFPQRLLRPHPSGDVAGRAHNQRSTVYIKRH